MKKHIIYLLVSGFALLSNMALTSCSDDDVEDANDVLVVKSVLPTKVMEGQVVTITLVRVLRRPLPLCSLAMSL